MKHLLTLLVITMIGLHTQAQPHATPTRGIGIYPGRPSESFEPTLSRDFIYRNTALNRMAFHSSSADANLTAQLITDGHIFKGEPASLRVSTTEGEMAQRDCEKTIDGNIHTRIYIKGEQTFVQFDWTGMQIEVDAIDIQAEAVYAVAQATGRWHITVQASPDGKTWESVGHVEGDTLPGQPTHHVASSDPNKQEDAIRLPMRLVQNTIHLSKPGAYAHLRLIFGMDGCAYWRLYETRFMRHGKLQPALPSSCYTSAWKSQGGGEQWVMVDLGTQVIADRVNLFWIAPPRKGEVLVSADSNEWHPIGRLDRMKSKEQSLRRHFTARYVKIALHQPGREGCYVLSEMQVMGRGGLTALPHERQGMSSGRYYLNGGDWRLTRQGDTTGGIVATVPGTVLQSYINIGALANTNKANQLRLASESFFCSNFVYTTSFDTPETYAGKHVFIHFDGINWKASVTLNGHLLGRIEGAFKRGKFDITPWLKPVGNALVIEVERPAHFGAVKIKDAESTDMNGGSLGADNPTFHASTGWDWITSTPGREVGIWDDVYLSANNGMSLADPLVTSLIDATDSTATMTPRIWVTNHRDTTMTATLRGWIGSIEFAKRITLAAGGCSEIAFLPTEFPQLAAQRMRLWWPAGYGTPHLYKAGFCLMEGAEVIDSLHFMTGIREMSYDKMDSQLQIFVNHRRVVPLGGNWGFSETNLNYRGREYDHAVRYHKEMHFNMIRNWVGQTADREFYEACDRHGIMVWQDFWLANPWDGPNPDDEHLFCDNADDYIGRIRSHPCLAIYVGRNEGYPPKTIDDHLRQQIASQHPGMGYISSSADEGVSGHGPYRAIPVASYFDQQTHKLHSERGMPNVPSIESMTRMLDADGLWPIGTAWGQHDFTMQGAQRCATVVDRVRMRFGEPANATQFTQWAQWINYEGYRAMYESAQQDRQGLLIWMSHPAWPSTVWQTYDYYLEPTAAYFGVRKACEPVHFMYNPRTQQAQVVNITAANQCDLEAWVEVMDTWGRVVKSDTLWVDAPADATTNVAEVKMPDGLSIGYLRLRLFDRGHLLTDNFYVQAAHDSCYQALKHLPVVALEAQTSWRRTANTWHGQATLTNAASTPALMVRLNLKADDGEQILPVVYSDNYVALMPGERRTIDIQFADEDGRGRKPIVVIEGFNVKQAD